MIPFFNDVERHGAVTSMSHEIVSECFIQHEKPEIAMKHMALFMMKATNSESLHN